MSESPRSVDSSSNSEELYSIVLYDGCNVVGCMCFIYVLVEI